jgi:spermidine synthase
MQKSIVKLHTLYLILFFSGFAGLGYEMVWTRMLSVVLGHEIVAVLAVVAAFFSGMALGAWSLDGMVSRSLQPGRWYAMLELGIGIWSLVLIMIMPTTHRFAATLTGNDPSVFQHWAVAFVLPFLLFLPATFAMGATLPAMERLFSRIRQDGRSVGGLYAANTFGAMAGTLLTTFIIAPQIGFRLTAGLLAAVNVLCAFGVLIGAAKGEIKRPPVPFKIEKDLPAWRILSTLFVTGLLGIGYEVLAIRVVSQVLENTIFSFTSLLSVYLLGTAAGAAIYQKAALRHRFEFVLTYLLVGMAFFCVIGVVLLPQAESIFEWVRNMLGGGVRGAIGGEISLACIIFFLPTLAMGATFSHLAQGVRDRAGGVGRALCVNTLGAAAAPLIFGVMVLPAIGAKMSLITISIGYILLIPSWRWSRLAPATVPLAISVALLLNPRSFNFVKLEANTRIAEHIEGVMAAVTVVEDDRSHYYLKVNNKFLMGSTASKFSDGRQGHIPLLLHPNPKRALFLGLGTGVTFAVSADHPGMAADGVELVPEIIEVLPYFEAATGSFGRYPELKIHVADARRYVHASHEVYDVIVADLFHPARDGAGFLYTVEHFNAIRSRQAPGGIFCQWLPLYQMDLDVLRAIIRTFLEVFPEGSAFLATYSLQTPIIGLIAGNDPLLYGPDYLHKRIRNENLYQKLRFYRLYSPYTLFGCFIAGPKDLAKFSGDGPLNTDDKPIVIFQAPRFVYSQHEPAHIRLMALLDQLTPLPRHILQVADIPEDRNMGERLAAYWRARDKFLRTGVGIRQTENVEDMLAQVEKPLLNIVRESPDFDAAYNPLVTMAQRLHKKNPAAAERLLLELEAANPMRSDARRVREYLGKQ